jgi:radical SAM superfamily enzyme YgiQ (UPF0313 family)
VKIAFVSGNREKLPDAVVPIGILGVMTCTPDHHEKHLLDLCFERHPFEFLRRSLEGLRPDVVAIGLRNLQNADYSGTSDQIAYYARLIDCVRETCTAPIVLGGAGFSVMPDALMERLRPDYGLAGEAEGSFPMLLEALESGEQSFVAIPRLYYFEDGELRSTPAGDFLDFAGLPPADRSPVDPRYYERYGIEAVQTKRGCPLRCDYCTYPRIEGRVGRMRSATAVVDEMEEIVRRTPQVRHFFFVDSVFNLPREHAKDVCRELIERKWDVPWTCYANPLGFDQETARLARQASCAGMEVGSDSGCDSVLRNLKKGFEARHIRALHEFCLGEGLPDCHTFILGTQGETLDDVKRTLDFIVDLDPFAAILLIWIDDYETLDPDLRTRRLRLREEVHEILLARHAEFPYWSIPPLGVNFDRGLFRRLRRSGLHGPLWQHIRPRGRGTSRATVLTIA